MTPRAYLAWKQGKRKAWSQFVAERVGPKGVNVSVRWLFTGRGPMTDPPPA
jgi:hypothetical protein